MPSLGLYSCLHREESFLEEIHSWQLLKLLGCVQGWGRVVSVVALGLFTAAELSYGSKIGTFLPLSPYKALPVVAI